MQHNKIRDQLTELLRQVELALYQVDDRPDHTSLFSYIINILQSSFYSHIKNNVSGDITLLTSIEKQFEECRDVIELTQKIIGLLDDNSNTVDYMLCIAATEKFLSILSSKFADELSVVRTLENEIKNFIKANHIEGARRECENLQKITDSVKELYKSAKALFDKITSQWSIEEGSINCCLESKNEIESIVNTINNKITERNGLLTRIDGDYNKKSYFFERIDAQYILSKGFDEYKKEVISLQSEILQSIDDRDITTAEKKFAKLKKLNLNKRKLYQQSNELYELLQQADYSIKEFEEFSPSDIIGELQEKLQQAKNNILLSVLYSSCKEYKKSSNTQRGYLRNLLTYATKQKNNFFLKEGEQYYQLIYKLKSTTKLTQHNTIDLILDDTVQAIALNAQKTLKSINGITSDKMNFFLLTSEEIQSEGFSTIDDEQILVIQVGKEYIETMLEVDSIAVSIVKRLAVGYLFYNMCSSLFCVYSIFLEHYTTPNDPVSTFSESCMCSSPVMDKGQGK